MTDYDQDTTIDLADTVARCSALEKRVREAAYKDVTCKFSIGGRGDELALYISATPTEGEYRENKFAFFRGKATADEAARLFAEADEYVSSLPKPAERGHAALAKHLARTAEIAEQFGLRDDDAQPWDAMAQFLRDMSQQVAKRGLPKPEDFPQTPVAAPTQAGAE